MQHGEIDDEPRPMGNQPSEEAAAGLAPGTQIRSADDSGSDYGLTQPYEIVTDSPLTPTPARGPDADSGTGNAAFGAVAGGENVTIKQCLWMILEGFVLVPSFLKYSKAVFSPLW